MYEERFLAVAYFDVGIWDAGLKVEDSVGVEFEGFEDSWCWSVVLGWCLCWWNEGVRSISASLSNSLDSRSRFSKSASSSLSMCAIIVLGFDFTGYVECCQRSRGRAWW